MIKEHRIQLLEFAQENIRSAIVNIREAVRGSNLERGAERYIIRHLKDWSDEKVDSYSIPNMLNDLDEEAQDGED